MIFEFKTARSKTSGYRKYLCVDTSAEIFSRSCPFMIVDGIEVKTRDYNDLIEKLNRNGFKEVERVY